jgi:hypothetical protein
MAARLTPGYVSRHAWMPGVRFWDSARHGLRVTTMSHLIQNSHMYSLRLRWIPLDGNRSSDPVFQVQQQRWMDADEPSQTGRIDFPS